MANSKELQALVNEIKDTVTDMQFDFAMIDTKTMADAMAIIFSMDWFVDATKKRNAMVASANKMLKQNVHNPAFVPLVRRIQKEDRALSDAIYSSLASVARNVEDSGEEKITNTEWKKRFLKTDDDNLHYNNFVRLTNKVAFILDIAGGYLLDALGEIHKVNASTSLPEYEGIKRAMDIIHSYSYQSLRENHPKINELFCEYSDSIGPYLDKRFSTFEKKLNVLRAELKDKGEIKKGTHDIKASSY